MASWLHAILAPQPQTVHEALAHAAGQGHKVGLHACQGR